MMGALWVLISLDLGSDSLSLLLFPHVMASRLLAGLHRTEEWGPSSSSRAPWRRLEPSRVSRSLLCPLAPPSPLPPERRKAGGALMGPAWGA